MLFRKLKKTIRKLFGLEEAKLSAEFPNFNENPFIPGAGQVYESDTIEPDYPPTCHMIRYPERIHKPGSQAIHKVSPKNFKPRPAHEKKLLKPNAKMEED